MALTPGNTIAGSTTLATLIDQIYANRNGLTAGSATIKAIDAVTFAFTWPGVGNGDTMIYFTPAPRAVATSAISIAV